MNCPECGKTIRKHPTIPAGERLAQHLAEAHAPPGDCICGKAHTKETRFYVSMRRTGPVPSLVAGPLDDHAAALRALPLLRQAIESKDAWAHFDSFGTSGVTAPPYPAGYLNELLTVGDCYPGQVGLDPAP